MTPPDPSLKGAWYPGGFNPCADQVKNRFQNVPFKCDVRRYAAGKLVAELGKGFDAQMSPREVEDTQATRVQQLLSYARFADPDGGCLSPAGEYNLRLGGGPAHLL